MNFRSSLISIIVLTFLISCSTKITMDEKDFTLKSKSEAHYSEEDGTCLLYPEPGFSYDLFGYPLTLDSDFEHLVDHEGHILKGRVGEDFTGSNPFGAFTLPTGTTFSYMPEEGDYLFFLEELTGEMGNDNFTFSIKEFLRFNEAHDFISSVSEEYSFEYMGQLIVLLKNDRPQFSAQEGFDYDFYSQEYRDQIEYDILKEWPIIQMDEFADLFTPPEGPGMHFFMGQSFFLKLEKDSYQGEILPVDNEEEVLNAFKYISTSRPYVSSYVKKLVYSFMVNQFGEMKVGKLHLLIADDEVANIQRLLNAKETLYLMVRLGIFSDFGAEGNGMIYFSYNQEQLDLLLNRDKP